MSYVGFDAVLAKLSCFKSVLGLLWSPSSQGVVFCVGFVIVFANLSCFTWVLMLSWSLRSQLVVFFVGSDGVVV